MRRRGARGPDTGRGALATLVTVALAFDIVAGFDPLRAETLVLRGATVHPVATADIGAGVVVVEGTRIAAVGALTTPPAGARVVELEGLHVYPGLIDANTVLGLVEIGSVRGTLDVQETGNVNPNARAEVALHADSELLPVARAGGILAAMSCARGGLIAGAAAVFQLDGWNYEDLTVRAPAGVLVNWPPMHVHAAPDAKPSQEERRRSRDERLRLLRQTFADVRAYRTAREAAGTRGAAPVDRDTRMEALLPVLRGEVPVLVAADGFEEIRAALRWAETEGLRMVLLSGADAARAAPELARQQVPVILDPTWSLPRRRWEPYDAPFTVAATLHAAGVPFCFSGGGGSFGAANARNLPHHAAAAVAHGLPRDAALRAMTLAPAQILGVADRLGSIEPGKDATLIVTDGDPLDIRTHVVRAFIAGREVSLENRQTRLYDRYRARPAPAPRRPLPE